MHLSSCGMDWRNTGESTTTIISGCYCIFERSSCLFQPPETVLISLSVSFNMVSIILRHYDDFAYPMTCCPTGLPKKHSEIGRYGA